MCKKTFKSVFLFWLIIFLGLSSEAAITGQNKETFLKSPSPDSQSEVENLEFKISWLYRPSRQKTFKTLTEGSILYSGALYKIIFTPSVDCFVYIFQVDGAGKIFQLFPMESFGGVVVNNFNPVEKDTTYYLPAEGKSFQLDEQSGTEKIYFLASKERDLELESLYQKAFEAQQQPQDELETQLLEIVDLILERAIAVQGPLSPADDDAEISWEEEGRSFTILQRRLENMCDGCVYVLSFEHR